MINLTIEEATFSRRIEKINRSIKDISDDIAFHQAKFKFQAYVNP